MLPIDISSLSASGVVGALVLVVVLDPSGRVVVVDPRRAAKETMGAASTRIPLPAAHPMGSRGNAPGVWGGRCGGGDERLGRVVTSLYRSRGRWPPRSSRNLALSLPMSAP